MTPEHYITSKCEHPPRWPGEPKGYLAWHEWADQKSKTHRQVRCPHCKLFAIWVPKVEARTEGGESQ